jgi:hypothetical protein
MAQTPRAWQLGPAVSGDANGRWREDDPTGSQAVTRRGSEEASNPCSFVKALQGA